MQGFVQDYDGSMYKPGNHTKPSCLVRKKLRGSCHTHIQIAPLLRAYALYFFRTPTVPDFPLHQPRHRKANPNQVYVATRHKENKNKKKAPTERKEKDIGNMEET